MKTKQNFIYLVLSITAFVILFYNQRIGLNFGILGLLIWGLTHYKFRKSKKGKSYWIHSIFIFIACAGQMLYSDLYSFFALFFSLISYGIHVQHSELNFVLYPLITGLNYISFPVRIFTNKWIPTNKSKERFLMRKFLSFILFPLLISIIFLTVYSSASQTMTDFFVNFKIDLNFPELIFLIFFGLFLFFNYWLLFVQNSIIKYNQKLKPEFDENNRSQTILSAKTIDIDIQRTSGVITMSLLNVILLVFVIIYNYEQFFMDLDINRLSVDTHTRVNSIIVSIVLAIGIILFYFHSYFNFDSKAGKLRKLSYLWLVLNTILVLSAFIKTIEYINFYGLTHKRIGVLIFLGLCFTGMFYSFIKILKKKTNLFLINKMAFVFYSVFVLLSVVNFSWIVTKYNLKYIENVDYNYLTTLNYNYKILSEIPEKDKEKVDFKLEKYDYAQYRMMKRPFLSQNLYFRFFGTAD